MSQVYGLKMIKKSNNKIQYNKKKTCNIWLKGMNSDIGTWNDFSSLQGLFKFHTPVNFIALHNWVYNLYTSQGGKHLW